MPCHCPCPPANELSEGSGRKEELSGRKEELSGGHMEESHFPGWGMSSFLQLWVEGGRGVAGWTGNCVWK